MKINYKSRQLVNLSTGHLQIDHTVLKISNLGTRVSPGTPGHARKSPRIATVKVRVLGFKRRFAAQKANETSRRPHLKAVADIEKSIISP